MRCGIVTALVLGLSFGYAVLRYTVFGPVEADHLPAFLANKAISVAALVLIVLAMSASVVARWSPASAWLKKDRRQLGMTGFALAGLHALLSVVLLTPAYFDKLFLAGTHRLTLAAEVCVLLGCIALTVLVWQSRIQNTPGVAVDPVASTRRRRIGTAVLACTLGHVFFLGAAGWLRPHDWFGHLPPISLISAGIALLGLVGALWPRPTDG